MIFLYNYQQFQHIYLVYLWASVQCAKRTVVGVVVAGFVVMVVDMAAWVATVVDLVMTYIAADIVIEMTYITYISLHI